MQRACERGKGRKGGLHAQHQAYRGVVGRKGQGQGRREEVVQWNSGRMRLNTRLVNTVLSCSGMEASRIAWMFDR